MPLNISRSRPLLCFCVALISGRTFVQIGPKVVPRVFSMRRAVQAVDADPPSILQEVAELEERANEGDPDAQFRLGQLLRKGGVVEKDVVRAFSLVLEAAEKEHVRAQYLIGLMLVRGRAAR